MRSSPSRSDVEIEARRIIADEYLGSLNPDALINWAVLALEAGSDGQNLRMLAATDLLASWFDVEAIFRKALDEMQITWPDRETALWNAASDTARRLQQRQIECQEGIARLADLARELDYPDALMEFYCLEDDLDIRYGPNAVDMEKWKEAVISATEQFLTERRGT